MKVDKKYRSLLNTAIMVLIMSSILSSIVVSYNAYYLCNGISSCFDDTFLKIWPHSFSLAFACGVAIGMVVSRFVRGVVNRLT
jgi:ABC-type antimicrobial peptide transport system permease subunit